MSGVFVGIDLTWQASQLGKWCVCWNRLDIAGFKDLYYSAFAGSRGISSSKPIVCYFWPVIVVVAGRVLILSPLTSPLAASCSFIPMSSSVKAAHGLALRYLQPHFLNCPPQCQESWPLLGDRAVHQEAVIVAETKKARRRWSVSACTEFIT